jgi:hypothetical protein
MIVRDQLSEQPYLLYYVLYFGVVILALGLVLLSYIVPIACVLLPFVGGPLIYLWLTMRGVNVEVKEAMKKGQVKVSGSRFSSSNPLTYEIEKSPTQESQD